MTACTRCGKEPSWLPTDGAYANWCDACVLDDFEAWLARLADGLAVKRPKPTAVEEEPA